jgi:hypothetical protein
MSKKIDQRIPREVGMGALPEYPAVKSPWERLITFHDAHHYALRHNASVAAAFMQVLRIVVPDYDARAKALCEVNHGYYKDTFSVPGVRNNFAERHNAHPFIKGMMTGVLFGDSGDECLLMTGRVNDYGTYRFEKELDACPWDIVGSEYCRCTTLFFQACGEPFGEPTMEYNMVEARGCGDLHCRCIGENREKYPMPAKEVHETFGPIATADLIKFTPEERCYKEPEHFREECNYVYRNGLNAEWTAAEQFEARANMPLGSNNVIPVLDSLDLDKSYIENVVKCVFEASGKMVFSEFSAIKGVRDWLNVPHDINDGRVLGGYLEVVFQATLVDYNVVAFNSQEVILDIAQDSLERNMPLLTHAYFSLWNGMAKTLVNAQWAAWREAEEVKDGIIRLKIAKKVDKYC